MNVRENQESTSFDDLMSRTVEIESIIKVIEGEHADEDDDSYVFAINGEYGSGKTKFLELFKKKIEGKGDGEEEKIKDTGKVTKGQDKPDRVLEIDAWRDSFANDPFLSICYGFFDFFEAENKNKLKKIINKISLPTLAVANQILSIIPGLKELSPMSIAEIQKKLKDIQKKVGTNLSAFSDLKEKKDAFSGVKELLKEYVKLKNETSGNEKPTYILVDELDRCSPEYAVKFLETIHHFFCVKGLVFIIAIDPGQLRSYVEKIYGVNNDRFDGWYAKFIKASYNLQSMWDKCHDSILTPQYIEEKLQELFPDLETNNKNTFIDYHETIGSILKSFSFTLRQVNFFIKSLKRWYLHNKSDNYHRNNADLEVAAFLIALKLKNSIDYNNLIKNIENKSSDSIEIKNGILNKYEEVFKGKNQKWIAFSLTSYSEVKKLAADQYKSGTGYCSQEYDELYTIEDGEVYCKKDGHEITQCAALTIHEEIEKMKDFG